MGNQNPIQIGRDPTINAQQIDNQESCLIFQDQVGQEYEKYVVQSDGSINFQNAYAFRVANRHNELVDVLFAGPQTNRFRCRERIRYQVVTERIPYRLSHMPTLNPHNALVVLGSCLRGFKDLFTFHGFVSIKESLIGITRTNRVKVWLNSNFALNTIQSRPLSLQKFDPKNDQREMVNRIFDVVNSKAQQDLLWTDLIQQYSTIGLNNFEDALKFFERYIFSKGIPLTKQLRNPFNKLLHHVRFESSFTINDVDNPATQINQNLGKRDLYLMEQRPLKVQYKVPEFDQIQYVSISSNPEQSNVNQKDKLRREIYVKIPLQEVQHSLKPSISSEMLVPVRQPFQQLPITYRQPIKKAIPNYHFYRSEHIIHHPIQNSSKIRILFNHSQPAAIQNNNDNCHNFIDHGEFKNKSKVQNTNFPQQFKVLTQLQQVQFSSKLPDSADNSQPDLFPPINQTSFSPSKSCPTEPLIEVEQSKPQHQFLKQPQQQVQVHEIASQQFQDFEQANLVKKQQSQIQEVKNDQKSQQAILSTQTTNANPAYRFIVRTEKDNRSEGQIEKIEQLKAVVNVSLIDKRSNSVFQSIELSPRTKRSLARPIQPNSLSYRQMRRLLLSARQESV